MGSSLSVMGLSEEIALGLVLHLDPDALEAEGGTFTGPVSARVLGPHFFLCVDVDQEARSGSWVPLFSEQGAGRAAIDKASAYGHPKWTSGESYYHPDQVWSATHASVVVAAGRDLSRPGARNGIGDGAVPEVGRP